MKLSIILFTKRVESEEWSMDFIPESFLDSEIASDEMCSNPKIVHASLANPFVITSARMQYVNCSFFDTVKLDVDVTLFSMMCSFFDGSLIVAEEGFGRILSLVACAIVECSVRPTVGLP